MLVSFVELCCMRRCRWINCALCQWKICTVRWCNQWKCAVSVSVIALKKKKKKKKKKEEKVVCLSVTGRTVLCVSSKC